MDINRREFIKMGAQATVVATGLADLAGQALSQSKQTPEKVPTQEEQVADLQARFQQAKESIKLRLGTEFSEEPGAVIFLSREIGMKKMLELARSGEAELAMLFLPRLESWITITKTSKRTTYDLRKDSRYVEAAIMTEDKVEVWHTHNDKSNEVMDDEKHDRMSLTWTMPSPEDFAEIYDYAEDIPGANLRGVVVSIHGTNEYWSEDPNFGRATYQKASVKKEADVLCREAGKASLDTLAKLVAAHNENKDNLMKLHFERVK